MAKARQKPLPFHQDLNGYERVTRAFARKAWSWGIPVWQDAGDGAKLLSRPGHVPVREAKNAFDQQCLAAGPWNEDPRSGQFFPKHGRQCVYLIHFGLMALHFEFEDGSNPFVKYGTAIELIYELQAWSYLYHIKTKAASDTHIIAFMLRLRTRSFADALTATPLR